MCATAGRAAAEWLRPDPSYQEAALALRLAVRDTAGRPDDVARLDSLGVALLRLGRQADAEKAFRRVLALSADDRTAHAGLGKMALFRGRLAEADSLLARATADDPEVIADRMSLLLRRGDYAAAAALAPEAGLEGRVALLEKLAADGAYQVQGGEAGVLWKLAYPLPLVNVKLNGQTVLMALDTGAGDLLVDESLARRAGVQPLTGQSLVLWDGSRVAVKNAVVRRLEIGGVRIEKVPAGILPLRKWSNQVNALSGQVAGVVGPVSGVIGVNLLRRFTPTLDYARRRLDLAPLAAGAEVAPGAARVPFEIWGENEIMLYGTLAGSRRMALLLATGLPGAGIGAPSEVMDEIGVKPGGVSRIMKGAGSFLGGRPWYEVGVPGVSVGPLARDKVPGWSGALDSGELWRHGVRRDAILAGEFFRDRRVTIDWQRMELRVEEGK